MTYVLILEINMHNASPATCVTTRFYGHSKSNPTCRITCLARVSVCPCVHLSHAYRLIIQRQKHTKKLKQKCESFLAWPKSLHLKNLIKIMHISRNHSLSGDLICCHRLRTFDS